MSEYYSKQKYGLKNDIFPINYAEYERKKRSYYRYQDYYPEMQGYEPEIMNYQMKKKKQYVDFERAKGRETVYNLDGMRDFGSMVSFRKNKYEKKNLNYEMNLESETNSFLKSRKHSAFFSKNGFLADRNYGRKNLNRFREAKTFQKYPTKSKRAFQEYDDELSEFDSDLSSFKIAGLSPFDEYRKQGKKNFKINSNKSKNSFNKTSERFISFKNFNLPNQKLKSDTFARENERVFGKSFLGKRNHSRFENSTVEISRKLGFEICEPNDLTYFSHGNFENKIKMLDSLQMEWMDFYQLNQVQKSKNLNLKIQSHLNHLDRVNSTYAQTSKNPAKKLILKILKMKKNDLMEQNDSIKRVKYSSNFEKNEKQFSRIFSPKNVLKSNNSDDTHENDDHLDFNVPEKNKNNKFDEENYSMNFDKNENQKIILATPQEFIQKKETLKRRSKRLMNKKLNMQNLVSRFDNDIFDSNEEDEEFEDFLSKKNVQKSRKKEQKKKPETDEISLFSGSEFEYNSKKKQKTNLKANNKKKNPSTSDKNQKKESKINYVDIRKVRKGSVLYKEFSKYFSIPLKEVIDNDDIFDDINSQLSDEKKFTDLSNLNQPSSFSTYYNKNSKKVKFEVELVSEERNEKELKSYRKKIRRNGKLVFQIKNKFGVVCSQSDIQNLIIRFKGLKRLKELILHSDEELKEYILDLVQ